MTEPVPGYTLSIMKEGRVVQTRCRGFADLSKHMYITSTTNFRLASLSKQFTAMAIMMLKENKELLFPAGSRYRYSDAGYVLLALVIEKISGLSYREFLKKNIFLPLGMNNSDVYDEKNQSIEFRAYGYRKTKMYYNASGRNEYNIFDDDQLNLIVGAEGVYSSVEDMMKWNQAWDTPLLVSQTTLQEACTPAILANGKTGKAGFSWLLGKCKGLEIIYQDGEWVGFRKIFPSFSFQIKQA